MDTDSPKNIRMAVMHGTVLDSMSMCTTVDQMATSNWKQFVFVMEDAMCSGLRCALDCSIWVETLLPWNTRSDHNVLCLCLQLVARVTNTCMKKLYNNV